MASLVAACSGNGPRDQAIIQAKNGTVYESVSAEPYVVVEVNRGVATRVSSDLLGQRYAGFFTQTGSAPVVIGPGDTLSISVVSSNNSGFVDFAGGSLNPISTATFPP